MKDPTRRSVIGQWIYEFRLRWYVWRRYKSIRDDLKRKRKLFRMLSPVPFAEILDALLPIALQHGIEFGELELNYPETNPYLINVFSEESPRRRVFYENVVAVERYKGFVWLVIREGGMVGFSLTSDRRLYDCFFLESSSKFTFISFANYLLLFFF